MNETPLVQFHPLLLILCGFGLRRLDCNLKQCGVMGTFRVEFSLIGLDRMENELAIYSLLVHK